MTSRHETTPTAPRLSDTDWAVLKASRPADYDGHTGFVGMTPAQRLQWLESAVEFVQTARGVPSDNASRSRSRVYVDQA